MKQTVDGLCGHVYYSTVNIVDDGNRIYIHCVRLLHDCSFNHDGQCEGLSEKNGQKIQALTLFHFTPTRKAEEGSPTGTTISMKKFLLLIVGVLFALPSIAQEITEFEYTYEGQTLLYKIEGTNRVYIKSGKLDHSVVKGDLIIPETVTDSKGIHYDVIQIGTQAFDGCDELTSVIIPNSVMYINNYAFADCSNLTAVTLPETDSKFPEFFNYISDGTFKNCSKLGSIVLPERVFGIGSEAFYGCTNLSSISLPDNLEFIKARAFYDCTSLTSIKIPEHVNSIYEWAFSGCSNLTEISIPRIGEIMTGTFARCTSLSTITISNSIKKIGDKAFSGCTSLNSATIPSIATEIGKNAFENCESLTSITIPNTVTKLGSDPFKGCTGLIKAAYPNTLSNPFESGNVTAYNPSGASVQDGYVYRNNESEIIFVPYVVNSDYQLPESVTVIGENSFEYLDNLNYFVIPDKITTLKSSAFRNCENLEDIILPLNLEVLGEKIFENCANIKNVVFRGPSPIPGSKNVFDLDVYKYGILHVRSGRQQPFMEVAPWNYFFNITDKPFTKVRLDITDAKLLKDETLQLTASVASIIDAEIVWNSSNAMVAAVSQSGLVTAVSEGTTTITATYGDESATCTITVFSSSIVDRIIAEEDAVEVYSLSGRPIMRNATNTDLTTLAPGIYIVRQGTSVRKIVIR